ncbi:MAG: pentapeptide repeat-containing protein, partial [Okeania sp. SIO3C4]|nr:pentapeptide repeat-containing protein [Okeania sp. SIO3C4]
MDVEEFIKRLEAGEKDFSGVNLAEEFLAGLELD